MRSITMTGNLLRIIGGRLNEAIKSLHFVGFVFCLNLGVDRVSKISVYF